MSKKSPKSQLSGLHRELGAILKEIKVITDKIRDDEESGSIEVELLLDFTCSEWCGRPTGSSRPW